MDNETWDKLRVPQGAPHDITALIAELRAELMEEVREIRSILEGMLKPEADR